MFTKYSLFDESVERESYSRDGRITYDKEAIEKNKANKIKCIFYYSPQELHELKKQENETRNQRT